MADGSEGKVSACSAGDPGLIPWLGRSLREGRKPTPVFRILKNPMDGGAWWARVHGVAKSQTRLSDLLSLSVAEICSFQGEGSRVDSEDVCQCVSVLKKGGVECSLLKTCFCCAHLLSLCRQMCGCSCG